MIKCVLAQHTLLDNVGQYGQLTNCRKPQNDVPPCPSKCDVTTFCIIVAVRLDLRVSPLGIRRCGTCTLHLRKWHVVGGMPPKQRSNSVRDSTLAPSMDGIAREDATSIC